MFLQPVGATTEAGLTGGKTNDAFKISESFFRESTCDYDAVPRNQNVVIKNDTNVQTSSFPSKRPISERSTPPPDYPINKRFRPERSHSYQETICSQESGNDDLHSVSASIEQNNLHTEAGDKIDNDQTFETIKNETNENNSGYKTHSTAALSAAEAIIQPQPHFYAPRWIPPEVFQQFAYHPLTSYPNPRWLQLCSKNIELPSMESVFRQPFDTSLLKRVYTNAETSVANIASVPQSDNFQSSQPRFYQTSETFHHESGSQDMNVNAETKSTESTLTSIVGDPKEDCSK